MPRVERLQPQVRETALPNARVSTDAPLEAFGGGQSLSNMTRAAQGLAGTVQQIAQEERQKADDIAVQEALAQTVKKRNARMYDPKEGAFTKRGKDSFGVVDQYGTLFNQDLDEIEKGLKTDSQKQMYRKIRSQQSTELDGQLQRHMFSEAKQYEEETTKFGVEAQREDAVLNYQDPEKVQQAIRMQETLLISQAQRNGVPAEVLQVQVADARSKTHAQVINRMLSNKQDLEAKDYFAAYKDGLSGDDVASVEKALREGSVQGESQRQAGDIMSKARGDLKSSLDAARKIEDPEVQAATVSEIKLRHSENEAIDRDTKERRLHGVINQITQSKQMPDPVTFARMSPEEKRAAVSWLEHMRKGTQPETSWGDYYDLKTIASSPATREQFLQMNLMEYRPHMADTEFKDIVNLQADLRKGNANADKILDGFRSDQSIVNDALASANIDPTPKKGSKDADKVALFRKMVDDEVKKHQDATGKKATNDIIQGIVDNLMVKGITEKGIFWDTEKRRFELESGEQFEIAAKDIPPAEQAKIKDALQRRNIPFSEQAMIDLYKRKIGGVVRGQ